MGDGCSRHLKHSPNLTIVVFCGGKSLKSFTLVGTHCQAKEHFLSLD